ncbi:MAG: alkane 1-monooxygenase [Flavobacteriales bacterium]|jgi:alkane 1-monooxygenase
MKDLKYLLAYLIPFLSYVGIYLGSGFTFLTVIFAFVLLPITEQMMTQSTKNLDKLTKESKLKNRFFDVLLYLNVPIVYGLIVYFIYWLNSGVYPIYEYVGNVISVGIVLGTAINVAHELGHRFNIFERVLSELLLLPNFYMHFIIEHNLGHHKHVSTPNDPATSRFNEPLYLFWIRSTCFSYLSAWNLERFRLKKDNKSFWSFYNKMFWFTLIQAIYITTLFLVLTPSLAILVVLSGVIGFLLLESINYIEHYGIVRSLTKSGGYERVQPKHSWNSNFELGRIVLYELTRHSDHHYMSNKKFQILDHHTDAPQLPVGYPLAILMSLVPPLWFSVMNKRLNKRSE